MQTDQRNSCFCNIVYLRGTILVGLEKSQEVISKTIKVSFSN